jgi:hypothetical protein
MQESSLLINYVPQHVPMKMSGKVTIKQCNVMGEILLSRYDLFVQKQPNNQQLITNNHSKTHLTTNLNTLELENKYGNRVRSRLREMFNFISFNKNAKDKRH